MLNRIKALLKQDKVRNFLYFSSASFISALIGIITLKQFTGYMPPQEFGIWSFALTFNSFAAAFIVLDLHSYFLIEASKDHYSRKDLLRSLLSFSFVWSLVCSAVFLLLGFLFFHHLFRDIDFFPYIFYILLSNLFMGFSQFLLIVFRIENKPLPYFLYSIFQSAFAILTSLLAVVYLFHDAHGRVIGYSFGMVFSGFIALLLLWKFHAFRFRINTQLIKRALKFSAPLIPYAIASLSMDFFDRVFLESYCSLEELGLFGLANQINTIVYFIFISLIRVYEPSVVLWVNEQQHRKLSSFALKYNWMLLSATFGLMLVSGLVVFQLTNARYANSVEIVISMSPFFYLKTISMLLLTILISGYKTFKTLYISLILLALYIVSGYLIIPHYGMNGMILVKTIVMGIGCILAFLYIGHLRHYVKLALWLLVSTAAIFILTFIVYHYQFYI